MSHDTMTDDNSRSDLIDWVNDLTKTNLTKIEQLGSGVTYCLLFDHVHPGKIAMSKVNMKDKNEYDYVQNFKVLQLCFTKLNIIKPIEIEKLIKCKYQDNLEFLQWIRKYFEQNFFDTTNRRTENEPTSRKSKLPPRMSKNSSSSNLQVADHDSQRNRIDIRAELQGQVDTMRAEKEYYFNKLRDIDQLMDAADYTKEEMIVKIREILDPPQMEK